MLRFQLLCTLALWGASLLSPRPCAAYCRTTTEPPPDAGVSPDVCDAEGYPLFWPTRHVHYALNERGVPGFDDAALRAALEQSFGAWTEIDCGDEPVDLSVERDDEPTQLSARPKDQEPRTSVVAYVPEDEWRDERHALAITTMRYNRKTGHILGADLLLNGANEFAVCPDLGCEAGEADLLNVVTHEAGHLLGLAHSNVEGSTMWWNTAAWETDKRSLEQDDIEGLCAIYGPNAQLGPPKNGHVPDGGLLCALGAQGTRGEGAGWLALGLAAWLAERRRR